MRYQRLDILTVAAGEGLICHPINAVGAIGGLAAAICKLDKTAAAHIAPQHQDAEFDTEWLLDMGTVILTACVANGREQAFAHCVTQQFPGSPVTESDCFENRREALSMALAAADEFWAAQNGSRLFLPYNACCGRAGDKWPAIVDVLQSLKLTCELTICVPRWAEASARLNEAIYE